MYKNKDREREKIVAALRDPFPLIVGGFYHEISNLMHPIMGLGEVIYRTMEDSDKNKKYIKVIIDSSILLQKIMEYLHSMAKYFYDEDEPILHTEVSDLLKSVRNKHTISNKNFKWSSKGIKKIPKLNFPPQILYFMISEIVMNAHKISKQNDIKLSLTVEFKYIKKEKILKIIATDNGPGYPKEFVEHQHVQNKTKAGGLYIIIETVRRLNGWVSIGNKPNGGAILLIAIPAEIKQDG